MSSVIGDLIRAFVEAVIVREVAPMMRRDLGIADDAARIEAVRVSPFGEIFIEWNCA